MKEHFHKILLTKQEVGGVKINFTNNSNVYNITSDSDNPTKVNYTQNGSTLNVDSA